MCSAKPLDCRLGENIGGYDFAATKARLQSLQSERIQKEEEDEYEDEKVQVQAFDERDDENVDEAQKSTFETYSPFANDVASQICSRVTIKVGAHAKVVRGGKVFSFSALVLVGNMEGAAGIGYGKALKLQDAIRKANLDAEKNMIPIYRWRGCSIKHDIVSKYVSSKVVCNRRL